MESTYGKMTDSKSLIKTVNTLSKAHFKVYITSSDLTFILMLSKFDNLNLNWLLNLTHHRILKFERQMNKQENDEVKETCH